ncbi:MAG TPA: hypothetical protein VKA53_10710 [Thermoanaerobaculia bacterium]|nr:hypothetical protein [Thermoanaerobaculia bacterium]
MAKAGAVRDVDHGYQEMKRRWMQYNNGVAVAVGIFGEAASQGKKGRGPDGEDIFEEAVTNVLVAAVHEFGTADGRVPSRSWLRAYVDENRDRIRGMIRKLQRQWMDGLITQDRALELLGAKLVGEIQARIARGIDPPLSEATQARRRGPDKSHTGPRNFTPLIDTGQFWQSIDWELRRRGAS